MKSNEKYVFSSIYYLRRCLAAEAQNFTYQRFQPVVKRRRRHAFTGTYNLSAASNPRVLVEYYRPKQAPNLPLGQNLPVSILI